MKFNRRLLAILLAFALTPTLLWADEELTGSEAPDFALKSLAGAQVQENLRLSEYRGDVVMLNFWSSRCGDCRESMPALNDLYRRYEKIGLKLLSVNLDRDEEDAIEMARSLSMEHPMLFDRGLKVSRLYDVNSLPVLVFIDRDGVVRHVAEGYRRGREAIYLEQLRVLLRD